MHQPGPLIAARQGHSLDIQPHQGTGVTLTQFPDRSEVESAGSLLLDRPRRGKAMGFFDVFECHCVFFKNQTPLWCQAH
jgi:hypothetical protein